MEYSLYLDSRDRIKGTPANAFFQLSQPLINVKSIVVETVCFSNTLINIDENNNSLAYNNGDVETIIGRIPIGYYTPQKMVDAINTLGMHRESFQVGLGEGDVIQWSLLPGTIIYPASLGQVLGFHEPMNANTTTQLVLAAPMGISFSSPSLQPGFTNVFGNKAQLGSLSSIIDVPIIAGHHMMQTFQPQTTVMHRLNSRCIDTLQIIVSDSRSRRVCEEMNIWGMNLRFRAY